MLVALIERAGPVKTMHVATLAYSRRNLATMLDLLDTGRVKELTLLASAFFKRHNRDLWEETAHEFRERKQRAAAARVHAKVAVLLAVDGGTWTVESSANLRNNGNAEHATVFRDPGLFRFTVTG
jgi:hypothetical protein